MPKVSIIIPVYNVESQLRQCLDSVVNQTLHDIEIICVDDGSTDGSAMILQEYAENDSRIKVLSHEHANAGFARNVGMEAATGEYLGFVDSDDWCELSLFEKAYDKAKWDDADIVLWRYREYDDHDGIIKREVPFGAQIGVVSPFAGSALKDNLFSCFNFAPWNRLVRTKMVRWHGLEFQHLDRSNDVSFGCLTLAVAARISVIDKVLYNYRVRAEGSLQSDNYKTPLSIVEAWKFLVKELSQRDLTERYRRCIALSAMFSFVRTFDVLSEWEIEYSMLFDALKELFTDDEFFSTVQPLEINNAIVAHSLTMIRQSASYAAFAIRQAADFRKWMMKFYKEREVVRKELKKWKPNCRI